MGSCSLWYLHGDSLWLAANGVRKWLGRRDFEQAQQPVSSRAHWSFGISSDVIAVAGEKNFERRGWNWSAWIAQTRHVARLGEAW